MRSSLPRSTPLWPAAIVLLLLGSALASEPVATRAGPALRKPLMAPVPTGRPAAEIAGSRSTARGALRTLRLRWRGSGGEGNAPGRSDPSTALSYLQTDGLHAAAPETLRATSEQPHVPEALDLDGVSTPRSRQRSAERSDAADELVLPLPGYALDPSVPGQAHVALRQRPPVTGSAESTRERAVPSRSRVFRRHGADSSVRQPSWSGVDLTTAGNAPLDLQLQSPHDDRPTGESFMEMHWGPATANRLSTFLGGYQESEDAVSTAFGRGIGAQAGVEFRDAADRSFRLMVSRQFVNDLDAPASGANLSFELSLRF